MIRKPLTAILIALMVVFQSSCSKANSLPEAKITLRVVDEEGKPIERADTGVTFEVVKNTEQGTRAITVNGITDLNGNFSASGKTVTNIAYGASKDGYYKSFGEYNFEKRDNGRWKPWNPEIKLVLRKIGKPVPMYAREFRRELPVTGKKVGFDLIKYDWVAPYGIGIHSDIVFKLDKQIKSRDEFNSKLVFYFSNHFDGIQIVKDNRKLGSQFKLRRFAPENGYKNEIEFSRKNEIGKSIESSYNKENNYIFRVRSEEKNGKLIRAMYGKIQGDVSFDAMKSATGVVVFRYYLNPDYTNNLEFDINRTLFTDLKSGERIGLD